MNIKCLFGHKFGKVINGYQYCQRCGKAIRPPCRHKWEIYDEYSLYSRRPYYYVHKVGKVIISRCKYCGEIKKDRYEE